MIFLAIIVALLAILGLRMVFFIYFHNSQDGCDDDAIKRYMLERGEREAKGHKR